MTDLTITATSVVPGADAVKETGVALSTITAGQVVYRDPTTRKFAPADANGAAALRAAYGIALNGAAADQPVVVQTAGTLTIGATTAAGVVYVLSANAGGIAPVGDLDSGHYTNVLAIGVDDTDIKLGIFTAGVAVG